MDALTNVTFDELKVGMSASTDQMLTQTHIDLLALGSGDVDTFHLKDSVPGEKSGAEITEAAGASTFLSVLIGSRLPGPGSRIMRKDMTFDGYIAVGDMITATIAVKKKQTAGSVVVFDGSCVNQRGERLVSGTITVAAPTKRISYSELAPPKIAMRRGDAFIDIFKACEKISPVPCAVIHPCDRDSLVGALEAAMRGFIEPILIAPRAKLFDLAAKEGIDISPYRFIDVPHSHAAAEKGVQLAQMDEAHALMKGSLHTDEVMGAVVASTSGMRTPRRVSHVLVLDVPAYSRMLLLTDAAINIYPNLEDKTDIVQNAIELAQILGIETPKVAILSAVETVTSKIKSTLDAAALCKMAGRGQIRGGILDGPLAFDNAISKEAARVKGITSPVSGEADILLVPDLEAGNMLYKQLTYLAGAESAGIVLGAKVPIILTSRADSVRTRLASAAVMALVACSKHGRMMATSCNGNKKA